MARFKKPHVPRRASGRVHRRTAAGLALLVLTSSLVALGGLPATRAQGSGEVTFTVNVVSAVSLGCSPDRFTSPDLRVRVLLDGVEALVTPEASDQQRPVFGVLANFTRTLPVRVSVEVQEGEPGGFLLLSTTWVPCDTAEGTATVHELAYAGGVAERIVARGDGQNAAEAILVLGRAAPPAPAASVRNVTAGSAELAWDRPASNGSDTSHRVARGDAGEDLGAAPPGATHATLAGLCDGETYSVRVLRERAPWTVSSDDVTFTTPDVAPQAARILRADVAAGNLTVEWESATLHDVEAFEVHVGAKESFTPAAGSLRETRPPSAFSARQPPVVTPLRESDRYVKVRTVDGSGLWNVSLAFVIGSPEQPPTLGAAEDCSRIEVRPPASTPDGAPTAAPTPTPTSGTPTTTTPPSPTTPTPTTAHGGAPGGSTSPDDDAPTNLLPKDDDPRLGTADAGKDEGILDSRLGVLLLVTVGLLGVAVGALVVLLLRR